MDDLVELVTDGLVSAHGLFVADEDYEAIARVALAAIEAAGYRVVPVEPTEAMMRAGWADAHDEDAAGRGRRAVRGCHGVPRSRFNVSFTSWGLALPFVAFIT